MLRAIANGYRFADFEMFNHLLAEDCHWTSDWSEYVYHNYKEMEEYFIPKFKTLSECDEKFCYDYCDEFIPKENRKESKILLKQIYDGDDHPSLLNIHINKEGLIDKISLEDITMKHLFFPE